MTLPKDKTKEKLIEITLELMDSGGLDSVQARQLAKRADVSVGTVYNLFGNVDCLILAACSRIFDDLGQVADEANQRIGAERAAMSAEGGTSPAKQVKHSLMGLADAYVAFVAEHEKRWTALLAFNRSHASVLNEAYLKRLDGLIAVIGNAFSPNTFGGDQTRRMLAGRALWSSVHGIVTIHIDPEARARTLGIPIRLHTLHVSVEEPGLLTVFLKES